MTTSRTSFGLVVGALVVVLILGGILFATGYFGERTEPPVPTVIHAGWKTSSENNTTFKFPEDIGTTYITTTDWPPHVQIVDGPFTCTTAGSVNMPAGKTEVQTINGRDYCVTTEGEGAAGSTYLLYAYAFPVTDPSTKTEKVAIFTFGVRQVQCANYDDPQKTACENERVTFNISALIDEMAQTITFINEPVTESLGSIQGTVLIGPTCPGPVQMGRPDGQCEDKPYAGDFVLTTTDGAHVVKEFSSDSKGEFSFEVQPGQYAIRSAAPGVFPRCGTNDSIVVKANESTEIMISCDSGIR